MENRNTIIINQWNKDLVLGKAQEIDKYLGKLIKQRNTRNPSGIKKMTENAWETYTCDLVTNKLLQKQEQL